VGHCIDVSESGIRIALVHPTDAPFLQIEPMHAGKSDAIVPATMKVLRTSIEDDWYTYAGNFVQLSEAD